MKHAVSEWGLAEFVGILIFPCCLVDEIIISNSRFPGNSNELSSQASYPKVSHVAEHLVKTLALEEGAESDFVSRVPIAESAFKTLSHQFSLLFVTSYQIVVFLET